MRLTCIGPARLEKPRTTWTDWAGGHRLDNGLKKGAALDISLTVGDDQRVRGLSALRAMFVIILTFAAMPVQAPLARQETRPNDAV